MNKDRIQIGRPEFFLGLLIFGIAFSSSILLQWDRLDIYLIKAADERGYYQYLPGIFIEGDLSKLYWTHHLANGLHLNLFTIGVAILQLPFFLLGHMIALLLGYPATGYTPPYALCAMAGGGLYSAVAGVLISLHLKRSFPSVVGIGSVLILYLGTNMYYYLSLIHI